MKDEKFYTLSEACHMLDCSEHELKDSIHNGQLKAYKQMNKWFVTHYDLLRFIKGKPPESDFHTPTPTLCAEVKRLHKDGAGHWFLDMVLDEVPLLTEISEENAQALVSSKVFRQCTETLFLPDEEHGKPV